MHFKEILDATELSVLYIKTKVHLVCMSVKAGMKGVLLKICKYTDATKFLGF